MTVKNFIDWFKETGLDPELTELCFEDEPFLVQKITEFEDREGIVILHPEKADMSNKKRNQEIFALHECGQSYSRLGIRFGLSSERIRQIYKRELYRVNAEKAHLSAVNGKIPFTFWDALKEVCETEMQATRIFRCLNRAGIINEIESHHDTLDTYSDETLLNIRNFGTISLIFARRANKLYKQKRSTCL